MKNLFKILFNLYFSNFWLWIKILCPLLIPIAILRPLIIYTYLGEQLSLIFVILFSLILGIINLIVEIIIIRTINQLAAAPRAKISLRQSWREAPRYFLPILLIKIMASIVILGVPFLFSNILRLSPSLEWPINIFNIIWMALAVLLFLFSSQALLLENYRGRKALERSIALYRRHFTATTVKFLGLAIIIGLAGISLSSLTSTVLAFSTGNAGILFNQYLSFWWERLIMDIYVILSLPLLFGLTTTLFHQLQASTENKKISQTNAT